MHPDFLILGAMRSGTTSMYRYLAEHPSVFMAPKELQYFTEHFGRGPDWYQSQFAAAAGTITGEATADYFARASAMGRIAEFAPHAKLIVSLRNPVDRAWSHYLLLRERGVEARSFREAIETEQRLMKSDGPSAAGVFYLLHSLYDVHLARLAELFPAQQVHISIFETMRRDPVSAFQEICVFLDIDPDRIPTVVGSVVNPYIEIRSLALRRAAQAMGGPAGRLLARLNSRRVPPPKMAASDRELVASFFRPRLSSMVDPTGRDLTAEWTV